ncbi:hypothetical protein Glove_13g122 [Diversispora epigaea]|uniref:BTB domain-containing protein n=1 Tax=Diversispora epigaea TaxID=1348612 RepID=A0A397JMJ8_9GLOM|nr:hypothetical protein Glove_13g122 [Diversispora epigaea]
MSLKFFDKLFQNFIDLLNDKDDYNVIIEIENKEKLFTAHSNILKYRSPYFRKELENIQPNENNVKTIIKSNVSSQIFDVILKYIYGGIVNLENVETRFIFDLMLAANEFELKELTNKLEILLIDTKASWLKTYFSLIYRTIFNENNFKNLENYCNDIIAKHPNIIFDSSDFTSLPVSALVSLLKRDDLQMEEVKIWDYVIKWGIAQNSTLPTDLEEWSKDNFLTLKTTLQPCLPLIRIVNLENVETRFIFDLMLAANEFELKELTNKLEILLIDTKASWLKTYFSLIYRTIFNENNFKNLENYCNDIIAKHPNIIFDSSDFTSLPVSALVSLLKRDDLQMEEVKIWDYVIKWGIAQNSTLPTDLEEWSKDNFLTLKTTLQPCLPLIRYFHISNIEIFDKIRPYQKLLDKQLWLDINQHLIAPDRPVISTILPVRSILLQELPLRTEEPFSTIISEGHAAEISAWIDRKTTTYSTTNIPYKFELILRGTRDGFAPQTFWNICHGHAKTVVVIKVKGTNEILGGYNPLAWDIFYIDGKWMKTIDSFIFSLKNGNIQNSVLSRVQNSHFAIRNASKDRQNKVGPRFGEFFLYSDKSDFTLDQNRYYVLSDHYEKQIRTSSYFSIVNYEVFKIVRKS